jgi:Fe-S cluster assembly ATP-binding protein
MGHPGYVVTEGSISINSIDITKMPTDQRAKQGLFLGFQYPVEVSGVNFSSFLRMAINEKQLASDDPTAKQRKISPIKFRNILEEKAKPLAFRDDISKRSLNEGFSGGEKKKAEILQMALLKPDFAVLDEPDSGLDVDALKYIANAINSFDFPFGLILITHYQRILHYIKPQFVHILVKGKIVKSGDHLLAKDIEEKGYEEYL